MKFLETAIPGVFEIELEPIPDQRGFFARSFCKEEFAKHKLETAFPQTSVSYNHTPGVLRGLHFQIDPLAECKIIRCTSGSLFDVVVDLRPQSLTFKKWIGIELSSTNRKAVYIPQGLAHGFQTLSPQTEVLYMISQKYSPDHARTILWSDPDLAIKWPLENPILSEKDQLGTPLKNLIRK